jgi:uncharacterized protein YidB (DUF937 family)
MGFLDETLGKVVGSVMGGDGEKDSLSSAIDDHSGGDKDQAENLLGSAMSMVQKQGGLDGLLDKFDAGGLKDQAASWVGKGDNESISAEQLQGAIGEDGLEEVAGEMGVSKDEAGSAMSDIIPGLIDKLTPDGEVTGDQDDLLSKGLGMLKGKL